MSFGGCEAGSHLPSPSHGVAADTTASVAQKPVFPARTCAW